MPPTRPTPTLRPRPDPLRPERPRLPRRALLWYALAAALVVLTAASTASTLRRAARAEAAYGSTRPVAVAVRAIPAGGTLRAADVELRSWPTALVPAAALRRVPVGHVARHDLAVGEPLLPAAVSEVAGRAPSALLGPSERAVPVPVTVPGLDLAVGDRVDLLGGGAPGVGVDGSLPGATTPTVVAAGARVLTVGPETVVVAVGRAQATEVAAALTQGPILLALLPPGGSP